MAKKKTSAEMAREQSELAKVEGMLGDAFGDLGGLEQSTTEEIINESEEPVVHETEGEADESVKVPNQMIQNKKVMILRLKWLRPLLKQKIKMTL